MLKFKNYFWFCLMLICFSQLTNAASFNVTLNNASNITFSKMSSVDATGCTSCTNFESGSGNNFNITTENSQTSSGGSVWSFINNIFGDSPGASIITQQFSDYPMMWATQGNLNFTYTDGNNYSCPITIAMGDIEVGNEWVFFSNNNGNGMQQYYTIGGLGGTSSISCIDNATKLSYTFNISNSSNPFEWNHEFTISQSVGQTMYVQFLGKNPFDTSMYDENFSWQTTTNSANYISTDNFSTYSNALGIKFTGNIVTNQNFFASLQNWGDNYTNGVLGSLDSMNWQWYVLINGKLTFQYFINNQVPNTSVPLTCNIAIGVGEWNLTYFTFLFFKNGYVLGNDVADGSQNITCYNSIGYPYQNPITVFLTKGVGEGFSELGFKPSIITNQRNN